MLESRKAGEGRKVQNTPHSFLLTEHSAISNAFIASIFSPPSVWSEITAPLFTRCIFRFALWLSLIVTVWLFAGSACQHTWPHPSAPVRVELCSFSLGRPNHPSNNHPEVTDCSHWKGLWSNGVKGSYEFEYLILPLIALESEDYTCIDPEGMPDCWVFKSAIPHDPFPCGRRMTWQQNVSRGSTWVQTSQFFILYWSRNI